MKNFIYSLFLTGIVLSAAVNASAHCEIPCGIYDDKARVQLIYEHIETVAKSMAQIKELSSEKDINYNQLIRWTTNKEKHATEIQEIVFQYFMTQRIKAKDVSDAGEYSKYITELTLLHKMLVAAMKSKQTTDTAYTNELHKLLEEFQGSYFQTAESKGSGKGSQK